MTQVRHNARLIRVAKEQQIDLNLSVDSAQSFNKILKKVLTEELESAILRSESEENVNTPDFTVTQSNLLGYRKALRFCLSLIDNQG